MPIGVYTVGLSAEGKEALSTLAQTSKLSSPAADTALKQLPKEDEIPVMEELINKLRQESDWKKQPKGFAGACKLAAHSEQAARILTRYLNDFSTLNNFNDQPPWMKAALKNQAWFKGA
jgi:predicted KAP-like P-loop ATPase